MTSMSPGVSSFQSSTLRSGLGPLRTISPIICLIRGTSSSVLTVATTSCTEFP